MKLKCTFTIIRSLDGARMYYHEIFAAVRKHIVERAQLRVIMIDGNAVDVYADTFGNGMTRSTLVASFENDSGEYDIADDVRDAAHALLKIISAQYASGVESIALDDDNFQSACQHVERAIIDYDDERRKRV